MELREVVRGEVRHGASMVPAWAARHGVVVAKKDDAAGPTLVGPAGRTRGDDPDDEGGGGRGDGQADTLASVPTNSLPFGDDLRMSSDPVSDAHGDLVRPQSS